MVLLCCLPAGMEASANLMEGLMNLPGHLSLETVPRVAQLAQRLQQPRPQGLLCLAVLPTRQDLYDLLAVQHLLQGIPLVLALPDEEPQIILLAHRLRPRYITFNHRPDTHLVIAQVVARMLSKYDQPWEPSPAVEAGQG